MPATAAVLYQPHASDPQRLRDAVNAALDALDLDLDH